METTLVILKPSALQRNLIGEILSRFERKGLQIAGIKMTNLSKSILEEHYSHLKDRHEIFKRVTESMMSSPVIVVAIKGVEAVNVVRAMTGATNGRYALAGTIRGDYSVSIQENIVHTSDSSEAAKVELNRFFNENEIFNYSLSTSDNLYASDEV